MIKLERIEPMNIGNAIRGMRNAMNSWDKSDSCFDWNTCSYYIGPNDLALAKKLAKAGSDHRKFLRQIMVSVDITAPLYWWKEFDTYKVGTVANSCSTMHKIHAAPFSREDFSCDRLDEGGLRMLDAVISYLEKERVRFVDTKDKQAWHNMIQTLPSSYNQMRTVTLNYEVLLNQHNARMHHKLAEWHTYCEWIEKLPYFKEVCLVGDANE
jgi:hypothetical protein